jgi:sugar/nucleoside kinase (ribokinase family)
MSKGHCVVAGHICLDIIPQIEGHADFLGAIRPGQLLAIGPPTMAPGGSVSNVGLALHKLGVDTSLMSKLGDDLFGADLRAQLAAHAPSLASGLRPVSGEHTSYSIILSPPDADRVFLHSTGANDTFGADDINYDALQEAALFHFGYPTAMARMLADNGSELSELLCRAKATGVTTSLDMSMFDPQGPFGKTDWRELLARALPYVDIFLPSLDEILLMLQPGPQVGKADPQRCQMLAEQLLAYGAGMVVLKQGVNGLYLRSSTNLQDRDLGRAIVSRNVVWEGRELWAPAFRTNVVGTTGAGDCAVGGFLASILRGLSPGPALLMAAAAGACNVEAADATSGLQSWTATRTRVEAGWEQHELVLPGWVYEESMRLWRGPYDASS